MTTKNTFVSYLYTENILCDIVAATNVGEKLSDWSCINGVTDKSVCGGTPWTGVGCDFNHMIASITLSSQQLKGTLPSSLAGLGSLSMLSLGYNSLSGTIPSSYGILGSLQLLDLKYNNLHGVIPSSFQLLCELRILDLAYNKLAGNIPRLHNNVMYKLVLEYNSLQGTIPASLYGIQNLYLSNNNLDGRIEVPPSLLKLSSTALLNLDVKNNKLFGVVPYTLCFITSLRMIDISGNNNLTCYSSCLSLVTTHYFGTVSKCSTGKIFHKSFLIHFDDKKQTFC